jgi:glucose/arabinose dehydrogenase
MQIIRGGLLSLAAIGCVCGTGLAQIPSGDVTIRLDLVVDGLVGPVGATHAGDGSGRLFIVDQAGQIRIVQDGALLATPFLDLTDKIVEVSAFFDERGVLGLAFHPDYENNGRFFVRYSAPREGDPDEPCNDPDGFIVGCHKEVLAEYAVSADPNVADPDSEVILFEVDEPQFNHNAGEVAFGPDGFLYFSLGDGGGAHDGLADVPPSHGPIGNGQNIETALGSMLRIDVDSPPDPGLGRRRAFVPRRCGAEPLRGDRHRRARRQLWLGDPRGGELLRSVRPHQPA